MRNSVRLGRSSMSAARSSRPLASPASRLQITAVRSSSSPAASHRAAMAVSGTGLPSASGTRRARLATVWASACSWEATASMSARAMPGRANRQWWISRTQVPMSSSCSSFMASKVSATVPPILFFVATTPASILPPSRFIITLRELTRGRYSTSSSWSSAAIVCAAASALLPSSPWYPMTTFSPNKAAPGAACATPGPMDCSCGYSTSILWTQPYLSSISPDWMPVRVSRSFFMTGPTWSMP